MYSHVIHQFRWVFLQSISFNCLFSCCSLVSCSRFLLCSKQTRMWLTSNIELFLFDFVYLHPSITIITQSYIYDICCRKGNKHTKFWLYLIGTPMDIHVYNIFNTSLPYQNHRCLICYLKIVATSNKKAPKVIILI